MGWLHRAARERDFRRRVDVVVMRFRWFMKGHFIVACDLYLCLHWKMKIKPHLLINTNSFFSNQNAYSHLSIQLVLPELVPECSWMLLLYFFFKVKNDRFLGSSFPWIPAGRVCDFAPLDSWPAWSCWTFRLIEFTHSTISSLSLAWNR